MELRRNVEINDGDDDDWGWIFEDTTLGYDD